MMSPMIFASKRSKDSQGGAMSPNILLAVICRRAVFAVFAAAVLVLSGGAAVAADVPFVFTLRGLDYNGSGVLQNGQFSGSVVMGGKPLHIEGQLVEGEISITVMGNLTQAAVSPGARSEEHTSELQSPV